MTELRPFRIVVAFDFSPQSRLAVRRALIQAAHHASKTFIHVVAVLDKAPRPFQFPDVGTDKEGADVVEDKLRAIVEEVAEEVCPPPVTVFAHALIGKPPETILELATTVQADLIVVGTHSKKAIDRWTLGSVSEYLVRHAPCTVTVVRESDHDSARLQEFMPEPPCPHCVAARRESNGQTWLCAEHSKKKELYRSPLAVNWTKDQEQQRHDAWVLY